MAGPIASFEGPKGFKDVFDMKLDYDWSKESFELIRRCVLKKFNAEVHSQSALEAAVKLKNQNDFAANDIESVDVTTFLTAYHIIGGGAYGDRKNVQTKEQADHSLFYLVAVALLDGEVYPEQFYPERIKKEDVQNLLKKVHASTGFPLHKPVTVAGLLDPYTQSYPEKMKTKIQIKLRGGKLLTCELDDYDGFFTRPLTWEQTEQKFIRLSSGVINRKKQDAIIKQIKQLETTTMEPLLDLISIPPS
jgi:2-methylcitrate dehydratase